jgi:DNA-binding NtrC family response regulator
LNVVELHLPPLRERRDDIQLLAKHFLRVAAEQFNKRVVKFSQSALHALDEYAWPGNVRELENVVQRAAVLCDGHSIETWHLPSLIQGSGGTGENLNFVQSYEQEVLQFKRRLILRTLKQCDWSKAETARTLGVARGYLHRLINQLDIREEDEVDLPVTNEMAFPSKRVM